MAARSSRRWLSYEANQDEMCSLCKIHHHRMSKVSTWHAERARQIAVSCGISEDDLVCRPCRDDIHRMEQNPTHFPRWEKKKSELVLCCVYGCNSICFVHTKLPCEKELEGIKFDDDRITTPALLCQCHYYAVYKTILHQQTNCSTCGNSFKHINSRLCPNTELISEHLRNMTGFEGNLEADSRVCYTCYKWQITLVQEDKALSRDEDLKVIVDEYLHKIAKASTPTSSLEMREVAMYNTVVHVGQELLKPMPSIEPIVVMDTLTSANSSVQLDQCSSRKRLERSSPISSPLKLTQTPAAKCRARTGTERGKEDHQPKPPLVSVTHSENLRNITDVSITDYKLNDTENESLLDLQHDLFTFFLQKVAIGSTDSEQPFMSIQDYFSITRKAIHTEKSKIAYLEVVDAIADCKDTQLQLLQDLFSKFIHNQSREYLIVEGDQKLFEVLQSLKIEYGKELDWVIPIPGDWHMLLNYHTALMKPYFDAGLKSLATAAEYPVAAIQACSQFKRTHNFLLEVWESLYRTMILMFLQDDEEPSLTELSDMIIANKSSSDDETLKMIMLKAQSLKSFEKFKIFIQKLGRTDSTWRFWIQFVFQDLMAYMGLFLAIRSGDWHLRKASIKQMAPIFSAIDKWWKRTRGQRNDKN